MDFIESVLFIVIITIIIVLYSFFTRKKRRLNSFCTKNNNKVKEALSEINRLKALCGFFSDNNKNKFLKDYKELYYNYVSLEKPKSFDEKILEAFFLFAKEYEDINATQFEHNIEYLTPLVEDAISSLKRVIERDQYFSDNDRDKYKQDYKRVYDSCRTWSKPQNFRTRKIDDFIQKYKDIAIIQFNHNVAFFTPRAELLKSEYDALRSCKRFIAHHELNPFYSKWVGVVNQFFSLSNYIKYKSKPLLDIFFITHNLFLSGISKLEEDRKADNIKYEHLELECNKTYFDNLFSYPLDEQQRHAIITLEDNTLVVSSAGSGKTSTIVAKVRYLVEKKQVDPKDILVVSYTNKAVDGLHKRLGIEGICCSTINKHAIDTIGKITKSKPTIVKESVMLDIFNELINTDDNYIKAVNCYQTDYANLIKRQYEYKTAEEYYADVAKYQLQSPYKDADGKTVFLRSKQEWQIAIILTNLGVRFLYECKYPHDTTSEYKRQYYPDFTIFYEVEESDENGNIITKNKELYLEHFGIDSNGNVPKWFGDGFVGGYKEANDVYRNGILWKREIHNKYNTTLIETTSADFYERSDMESYIEQLLNAHGVKTQHLTEIEKLELLKESNKNIISSLFELIKGFITLMKANNKTLDDIIKYIDKNDENRDRNIAMLDRVVRPVYNAYQKHLKNTNKYDFTDSLLEAARLCGIKNPYNYRYILIDEFQDISMDKYIYLKSLRCNNPYTSFFCVGDDWQSIYRFSGSDMTLFYDFQKFFGYTEECKIETTHRFANPLLIASNEFLLTNPEQKKKQIKTSIMGRSDIDFIAYENNNEINAINDIVAKIPEEASVFILGRYTFSTKSINVNQDKNDSKRPIFISVGRRKIPYLTIHSSKGLEADYIIILDCKAGVYGFPSLINNDPILEYVLSGVDSYKYAEERRVFYVAITRARKATYCLFPADAPSPFISEFGFYSSDPNCTDYLCPHCKNGYIRIVKDGMTQKETPYISIKCTNKVCNFFENIFDVGEISKYRPRVHYFRRRFILMKSFGYKYKWNRTQRIFTQIDTEGKQCACYVIPESTVVNKYFWHTFSNNEFYVTSIKYNDESITYLTYGKSKIYASDSELASKMADIKKIAESEGLELINPRDYLQEKLGKVFIP